MPRYLRKDYLRNNLRKVTFCIAFTLVNAALFTFSAVKHRQSTWALMISRGCGMALNFNSAFVLVLMLRSSLTWVRSTRLGTYLPVDQNVFLHKMVGVVVFVQSFTHGICHLINLRILKDKGQISNVTYAEIVFLTKGRFGWIVPGFAFPSGVLALVVLAVMVVGSMSCVRRSGYFQVFYWSHTLYVVYWALLFIHGPIFWCFLLVPGIVFVAEKCYRSKAFKLSKFGKVYIEEVNLLPSRVTHLTIARPDNFRFRAGDYLFINIPTIAKYEWHPFTISSCPENTRELWLHIRSVGDWTGKLYDFFNCFPTKTDGAVENGVVNPAFTDGEESNPTRRFSEAQCVGSHCQRKPNLKTRALKSLTVNIQCYLDGPFGTGSSEVFQTEEAVLIASGIGVTPFASVLQSISKRRSQAKTECPHCGHILHDEALSTMALKKVNFVWINRDQKSFEWFVGLLTHLELEQDDDFLEMRMYMTAMAKNNIKALGLQMAMEILHNKEHRDILTGLKTRTEAGRPDWDEIFDHIAKNKRGKVKVFFCGSPLLAKTLKKKCEEYDFQFAKENFQ